MTAFAGMIGAAIPAATGDDYWTTTDAVCFTCGADWREEQGGASAQAHATVLDHVVHTKTVTRSLLVVRPS